MAVTLPPDYCNWRNCPAHTHFISVCVCNGLQGYSNGGVPPERNGDDPL